MKTNLNYILKVTCSVWFLFCKCPDDPLPITKNLKNSEKHHIHKLQNKTYRLQKYNMY